LWLGGRSLRGTRRAQLYFDCLRRLLEAAQAGAVNQATTRLLGAVIDTYLPVNVEDRVALRVQLEAQGQGGAVMAIEATELTWRDQVELEATRRTKREVIRRALHVRFGHVAPEVEELIDNTAADTDLDALFDRALLARSESDVRRAAP
jgi:hypothetical protein